uniref:T-cell surface glycoprotein CD1a-like n=1 Tax=Urocitellus parryii TaxID=9999 RepID=A0A8D2GSL0_UROPR
MMSLLLPLLAALFPGDDSEYGKNCGFEEPVSYHLLQTSAFHNHSWVHLSSGWLGELQIHSCNISSGAFIYLYPWSRGNFSNRELMDLESFFWENFIGIQEVYTDYFMFEDPFDLQMATGCELHSGKGFLCFLQLAIQGSDFMSFQNETWSPSPEGGIKAQEFCKLFNLDQGFVQGYAHTLLSDTFPHFTLALLDAGKAHLQRQAPPSALGWILSAVTVALALLTGLGFWFRKHW